MYDFPQVRPWLLAAKQEAAKRKLLDKKSNNSFVQDIYQTAIDAYAMVRKKTGLVFDQSMAEHECLWDPNYPECPARFTQVLQRCEELGLVKRCKIIESRSATESEILTKHTQKQIDILKATHGCVDIENLELLSSRYDAIFIHPVSICKDETFLKISNIEHVLNEIVIKSLLSMNCNCIYCSLRINYLC